MIPKNIIDAFKSLANSRGYVSVNAIYNLHKSFYTSNKYQFLYRWLYTDEVGQEFFRKYGQGFYLDSLINFDPDEPDNIEGVQNKSESNIKKSPTFSNPKYTEIVRILLKQYDLNSEIPISELNALKKSPIQKISTLFNSPEGGEISLLFHNKKIKTVQDVIDYFNNKDEKYSDEKISINSIKSVIKPLRTSAQTYFSNDPHYVCSLILNKDIAKRIGSQLNNFSMNYMGHTMSYGQILNLYMSQVHTHSLVTVKNEFTIGWIRFTVKPTPDGKVCIIDELQSDLNPVNNDSDIDMYKINIPNDIFESHFISVKHVYKTILQYFVQEIRNKYGFEKIYAPSHNIKAELAQVDPDDDFSKFEFLEPEEIEKLKTMKPPMFPYKDIIPSVGFSKQGSDIPGFLVLENVEDLKASNSFDYGNVKEFTIKLKGEKVGSFAVNLLDNNIHVEHIVLNANVRGKKYGQAILNAFMTMIKTNPKYSKYKTITAECVSKQSLYTFKKAYGTPNYMMDNYDNELDSFTEALDAVPATALIDNGTVIVGSHEVYCRWNINQIRIKSDNTIF